MIEVEGIITLEYPYGETSKIIKILTKQYGIISVMCKGAKSIKSKFRCVTGKLTYGKFWIYYKKDKMSILNDVEVYNNFDNIKTDIIKLSYSVYLLDLTNQVYMQYNSTDIIDILLSGLYKINDNVDASVITNIIEIKYLNYLGVGLCLDKCVICSNKKNIVTINTSKGGLICNKCYDNDYIYDIKIIKYLNLFNIININNIDKLDINSDIKNKINKIIEIYYKDSTGLYLKSKEFIKEFI